jgi:carboxymethylenebutenolidase
MSDSGSTTEIAVPYFHARPAGPPPWPGVVVIHEGNGMSTQLLQVCQRLAGNGYAVVAPDLFWRFGGSDPEAYMDHLRAIDRNDVRADLAGAAALLRELGASSVGVTGFCMGGTFSYLAATSGVDVQCAAPFYGSGIAQDLKQPGCPMLLFFGGRDDYIPMADIEAAEAYFPGRVVVYPEAGHGFMRDGSESYSEAAATDAWRRLLDFFGEHLGARATAPA